MLLATDGAAATPPNIDLAATAKHVFLNGDMFQVTTLVATPFAIQTDAGGLGLMNVSNAPLFPIMGPVTATVTRKWGSMKNQEVSEL